MASQRFLHEGTHAVDLLRLDFQVGNLTLHATGCGLVNQHAGVGQSSALAGRTCGKQHGGGRCGLAQAHGLHVGAHVLHGVVNSHQAGEGTAGRIDVHRDVPVGVQALEHQQLSHDVVSRGVVNLGSQEDDALLKQLVVRVGFLRAEAGVLHERRQNVSHFRHVHGC